MHIKLSNRLRAVAEMVIPGRPAADIGTDHGYLAVYLIVNGICPSVIATDRVRGPLSAASQLVSLLNLDSQVKIRLGDGLDALADNEAETVCIAGMGGLTIKSILEKRPEVLGGTRRLVLQPQSNISVLRDYLAKAGWNIVNEKIAHDNGFFYEIIAAEKGQMELSVEESEFGPILLKERPSLLRPYLEQRKADLLSLLAGLDPNEGDSVKIRIAELSAQKERIEKTLAEFS